MTRSSDLVMVERELDQPSIATKQATDETAASVTEFSSLQEANIARQKEWDPDNRITLAYRGNELAGEVGEACNVIKKLERERLGINGSRDTVEHLLEELADSVICSYLVAMHVGGDLEAAIVAKFNATSEKMNLKTRMRAARLTKTPSAGHDAGNLRGLAAPAHQPHAVSQGWRTDLENAPGGVRFLIAGRYPNGIWYVEESYRHYAGHFNGRKIDPPTHWMPLPAPPSPAKTGGVG